MSCDCRTTDNWLVFLLTEQPPLGEGNKYRSMEEGHSPGLSYKDGVLMKLSPSIDLDVYAQNHCWLLFSSLTLSMAHAVNNGTGGE